MGDPLSLAVAGGVIGAGAGGAGASSQNAAIRRSMGSTVSGSQAALDQLQMQTAITAQKYANDSRRARGAVRVAAAGAGMSGADLAALQRQAAFDADLNIRLAKADAMNKAQGIRSQTDAALSSLKSQTRIPFVSGLTGALQGAIAGYALGSMFSSIGGEAAVDSTVWSGSATPPPEAIMLHPTGVDPALGGIVY